MATQMMSQESLTCSLSIKPLLRFLLKEGTWLAMLMPHTLPGHHQLGYKWAADSRAVVYRREQGQPDCPLRETQSA